MGKREKKKIPLSELMQIISLNNKVVFTFKSILSADVIKFKKLNDKFFRFKLRLDKVDPFFITYKPKWFVRLNKFINMNRQISDLFIEFFAILSLLKDLEDLDLDFYKRLHEKLVAIWRIRRVYNNHDFPRKIFLRGKPLKSLEEFDMTAQLILISQAMNEKKIKIYNIMCDFCYKMETFLKEKGKLD